MPGHQNSYVPDWLRSLWGIALWQSCNIGCKINHKVVNFGKWFLCQFSPKTWNFLHGAFLTPQKLEDEKVLTNLCMQRGEKRKKREEGVFHRQNGCQKICFGECYDICFLNICEKHPLVGENCIQSLKKSFTNISPIFFGCWRAAKYPVYKFTFTFHVFYYFSCGIKQSMIDNHSFRPPQMYLEYLDTDKMRG